MVCCAEWEGAFVTTSTAARIAEHLYPGARVAVADGAGMPTSLLEPLVEAGEAVGGVSVVLGWCLEEPTALGTSSLRDVRTFMGGFGLRGLVESGRVPYVPTRLRGVPALLSGALRPDVLLVGWRANADGEWAWGTEVSWMQSLVDSGVRVLAEHNHGLPFAARQPAEPYDRPVVVAEVERTPLPYVIPSTDRTDEAIALHLLPWVTEGCALQYGPSAICHAMLAMLDHPVHVRSGMVTDAVVDLDARGLLLGGPQATYVAGTQDLYRWADGRPIATRLEQTHAPALESEAPLVAINVAIEVDRVGQVNVERVGGRPISGFGGHPDFAMLGGIDRRGLSIIALPTHRGGRSTLVEALGGPVSTPRYDVDVYVTEKGAADVRGLSDAERAEALSALWEGRVATG